MFDIATIQEIEGEPRMRDLDIADALGFEHPRRIRSTIYRHLVQLSEFGEVRTAVVQTSSVGGRPTEEYWLNEQQAYYICTKSEAKKAFQVTKHMIEVFTAYRHGEASQLERPATEGTIDALLARPDYKIRVALINNAYRVYGRKASQQMWRLVEFPEMPSIEEEEGTGPQPTDDISLFLQDYCICRGDTKFTPVSGILAAYRQWCTDVSRQPLPDGTFTARLSKLSRSYLDPATGFGFTKHKASVSGYLGLSVDPFVMDD